jgi:hypothetical protein
MIHLPSWRTSDGWELTRDGTLEMAPGGPLFAPKNGPLVALDEALQAERALNPASFAVEFGAAWAAAQDPYLNPDAVHNIFGHRLEARSAGSLGTAYHGYADPGLVDDHFAFVIAHLEPNHTQIPDVVFDVLEDWDPKSFTAGAIDTIWATDQLFGYLCRFHLTSLTLDQFNGLAIADGLRARVRDAHLFWHPIIEVHQGTRTENYQRAETFKRLAYAGTIHAPENTTARDEFLNLRDNHGRIEAPTSGRITHDDLAIAMINAVATVTAPYHETIRQLGALTPHFGLLNGLPIAAPPTITTPVLGRGGFPVNPYADQLGVPARRRSSLVVHRPTPPPRRRR